MGNRNARTEEHLCILEWESRQNGSIVGKRSKGKVRVSIRESNKLGKLGEQPRKAGSTGRQRSKKKGQRHRQTAEEGAGMQWNAMLMNLAGGAQIKSRQPQFG